MIDLRSPERSEDATRTVFRRWLLWVVAFCGVPVFLAWIGAVQIWERREADRRRVVEKRLDDLLSSFSELSDPVFSLGKVLREAEGGMFPRILSDRNTLRKRQLQVIHRLKRRFPGVFEFTVLDAGGQPVPELCDFPVPRALLRRLFTACRQTRTGDPRAFSQETAVIKSFLGPLFPGGVYLSRQVVHAARSFRRRFAYLSEVTSEGMFIVHVTQTRNWKTLTLSEPLRQAAVRHRGYRLALLDFGRPWKKGFAGWPLAPGSEKGMRRALGRLVKHSTSQRWAGSVLWGKKLLLSDLMLIGRVRLGENPRHLRERRILQGFLLGLWGFCSILAWFVLSGRIGWETSVRTTLVIAFCYAAGLPLAVLGVTARSWSLERRTVLERQLHEKVESALIVFDAEFADMQDAFSIRMEGMARKIILRPDAGTASVAACLEPLRALGQWDLCEVFTIRGERIFTEMSKTAMTGTNDFLSSMPRIATRILRILDPATKKTDQVELRPTQSDSEWMLIRMMGNIGRVYSIEMGDGGSLMGVFLLYDAVEHPLFCATVFWSKAQLQRDYLRQKLLSFSRTLDETSVFAFNRERPEWSRPVRFRYLQEVRSVIPTVFSAEQSVRSKIEQGDSGLLLTGIRGTMLDRYTLVGVTMDRSIRAELNRLALKVLLAGLFILLISAGVGGFVARAFLAPVRNLAEGVNALQTRQFQKRLPVLTRDELGVLSESFNDMLEGTADLELARVVQESLFPLDQLQVGGVTIFGRCRPAAQVGGDYLEYSGVDETSVVMIMGDVSGHGVSAALVMAMARAVFSHPGSKGDPERALGALNSVMMTTLKRKKMMTCLFGLLNLERREFRFCNAGQAYPCRVHDGMVQTYELPGKPLGISTRWSCESMTIPFVPGDWLLFVTDGVYEALDRQGEMIGWNTLLEALPEITGTDARAKELSLREWFTRTAAPGPLTDDVSMLVCHWAPDGRKG